LGFCDFIAGEAVLGHSASSAGLPGVSRHGGELDRSGPSQGTSHAHRPARVEAADLVEFLKAHEMAVPSDLRSENGTEMVVVVEDDVGYLEALLRTLERSDLDIEVVETTNGVDALLEIGRVRPTVILLDYTLPDLNARQLLERLLEPAGSSTPR